VYDYAAEDSCNGSYDDKGQEEKTGSEGRCFEYGLKVQWHIIFSRDENL
jgi:hypothetical protein